MILWYNDTASPPEIKIGNTYAREIPPAYQPSRPPRRGRRPYRSASSVLCVGDLVRGAERPVEVQLVLVQLQVEDGHHEHQVDHEEEQADRGAERLQLGSDTRLRSRQAVRH